MKLTWIARLGTDLGARAEDGGGDGQHLSAHKGGRVKEIIEGRGCELVYLAPYSPDFNPIEQGSRRSRGSWGEPRRAPAKR